jgi:enamine deaminase RidA (YjgF/YER057c/UK114 family)
VREALLCAGAELSDIVQVRTWLTNADDMETYVEIRKEIIGHKPALMLAVVPQLVRPSFRLEIEVVAAVASTSTTAAGQDE